MRTFENLQYGDETVIKASLEALANKNTNVEEYRRAFRVLGEELGKVLAYEYGSGDLIRFHPWRGAYLFKVTVSVCYLVGG